ncbi:MAG: hypothetical protein OQK73_01130 [Gammaproteobacteria bacterium]|nr:hypothetical protein [Gammaproteobacteria bacterium]
MLLALIEINHPKYSVAKIWVNTTDTDKAKQNALKKLAQDDIEVVSILDIVETDRSDYFAPCTSLDTFDRAEHEGIAVLLS